MTTQTQYEFVPANEPQFTLSATLVPDEQRINFSGHSISAPFRSG
ncbi:Uncharacterised protein [Yersinia enterocolitica]|nr:hypothetical protein FORC066_3973 [Yersinia enterocolitica]CNE53503.1 Uncharacterised protein [Yersinia enterocolitica]CQH22759.1 Uncharacterised protein [Yersinia enterocolitica]